MPSDYGIQWNNAVSFPFSVIFSKKFKPFIVSFHFFPLLYSCNLLSTPVELQPRHFFLVNYCLNAALVSTENVTKG